MKDVKMENNHENKKETLIFTHAHFNKHLVIRKQKTVDLPAVLKQS